MFCSLWGSVVFAGAVNDVEDLQPVPPEVQTVHEKIFAPLIRGPVKWACDFVKTYTAGPKQPDSTEEYKRNIAFLNEEIETLKKEIDALTGKPLEIVAEEVEHLTKLRAEEQTHQELLTTIEQRITESTSRLNHLSQKTKQSWVSLFTRLGGPLAGAMLGYFVAQKAYQLMGNKNELLPLQKKLLLSEKVRLLKSKIEEAQKQSGSSTKLEKLTAEMEEAQTELAKVDIPTISSSKFSRGLFYGLHLISMLGGACLGYLLATTILHKSPELSIDEKNALTLLEHEISGHEGQKNKLIDQINSLNQQKPTLSPRVSDELWPALVDKRTAKTNIENYIVQTKFQEVGWSFEKILQAFNPLQ